MEDLTLISYTYFFNPLSSSCLDQERLSSSLKINSDDGIYLWLLIYFVQNTFKYVEKIVRPKH